MPGSNPPTSILGLNQYTTTDDFDFNDVNGDNQRIDRLPPTECTSASRPNTNLYQGRFAWENDTGLLIMYDVSSNDWKEVGLDNINTWKAEHDADHTLVAALNNPPRCQLVQNAAQSIPNGTGAYTPVVWDAEDYDTANIHDNVTNNTRLNLGAAKTGLWVISSTVAFVANATGLRLMRLHKNGAVFRGSSQSQALSGNQTLVERYWEVPITVNTDYVEIAVAQTSGAALNTNIGSGYVNTVTARWVCP